MLNDDWIHMLIAHGNRQVVALLAAGGLIRGNTAIGAVSFELGPAPVSSAFFARTSCAK